MIVTADGRSAAAYYDQQWREMIAFVEQIKPRMKAAFLSVRPSLRSKYIAKLREAGANREQWLTVIAEAEEQGKTDQANRHWAQRIRA